MFGLTLATTQPESMACATLNTSFTNSRQWQQFCQQRFALRIRQDPRRPAIEYADPTFTHVVSDIAFCFLQRSLRLDGIAVRGDIRDFRVR